MKARILKSILRDFVSPFPFLGKMPSSRESFFTSGPTRARYLSSFQTTKDRHDFEESKSSAHSDDQENEDSDPVGYSGPTTVLTGLPRTIRRHELRLIVPLADSTIYKMEKRGELPRRFNLTPLCVVWDLEEVEAWLE